MFQDRFFILCEIDAEGLVSGDIRMLPLDGRRQFRQGRIRLFGGLSELLRAHAAGTGNVAFNDEFFHF